MKRTVGWLLSYKRLALRYDRRAATNTALASLAVTLIWGRGFRPTDAACSKSDQIAGCGSGAAYGLTQTSG